MSTPQVEKLRLKGCGGDGRRESQGGGDDGARGSRGDGWCHAGAGAGRRRVRVTEHTAWHHLLRRAADRSSRHRLATPRLRMRTLINFEARPLAFLGAKRALLVSITRGGEVRDLTPESL